MENADHYAIWVIAEATIWGKLGFLWLLDPQSFMTPDKPDNIEIDDDIKLEPYELNDQFSTRDTWHSIYQCQCHGHQSCHKVRC